MPLSRPVRSSTFRPSTFRVAAWSALVTQIGIMVTGAAVRLTGSGLGCTDWPGCSEDRLVPAWSFHGWVEFGNRLLTFVVTAAAAAAVVGAWRRRPYRRSLLWLSWGLVFGVIAQALIGAVLVIFELDPRLTVLHFAVSLLLVADAVILVHLSAADGGLRGESLIGEANVSVGASLKTSDPLSAHALRLAVALGTAATALVATGTVVTGSGPHGGDVRADRFGFALQNVARLHATAMWVFLGLLVTTAAVVLRSSDTAARLRKPVMALMVLTVGQAVLGYLQYALGVPAGLVALHVLGSALVWAMTVELLARVVRLVGAAPRVGDGEAAVGLGRSAPPPRPILSER